MADPRAAWKRRSMLWDELRGLKALLEPKGSRAAAQDPDRLDGQPTRTLTRGRQLLPVGSATQGRLMVGSPATVQERQLAGGTVPVIRGRRGLSMLWIDSAENMPIAAVPPPIRRSLYHTLTHRSGR